MSLFMWAQSNQMSVWQIAPDLRAHEANFRWSIYDRASLAPWEDAVLWPRTRFGGGEMGMGMLNADAAFSAVWGPPEQESGGQGQKKIIGTSRDNAGSALGNCIVQGFLTATDTFIGETTSDPSGYFELPTPYPGQNHYLVAYKAGSPDLAGTTVNTIQPA